MPRPRNNVLLAFFRKTDNQIICNNGNCQGKILNNHSGNLERHLRTVHNGIYLAYIKRKQSSKVRVNKIMMQTQLLAKGRKPNIELAVVDLFTKGGYPLEMADDHSFRVLTQAAFDTLNSEVSSKTVMERITSFSRELKAELMEELRGRLLCLKIDGTAWKDMMLLAINVQYAKEQKIFIRTLATWRIYAGTTTRKRLFAMLQDVLCDFCIELRQILTITTDNGTNDLLNAMPAVKRDNAYHALETTLEQFGYEIESHGVPSVWSGAQMLERYVRDVLAKEELKSHIDAARKFVAELHTPAFSKVLKERGCKKLLTDTALSWTTTFDMIERLVQLREIIEQTISPAMADWGFLDDFLATLRPVLGAVRKLQTEQHCFSELYPIIMDLLIQAKNVAPPGPLAAALGGALKEMNKELCANELFNAAIFLDPRVKVCLDTDQTWRAEKYIASLQHRLLSMKENSDTATSTALLQPKPEPMDEQPSTSHVCSFSEYLQKLDPGPTTLTPLSSLDTDILVYKRVPRAEISTNVLEYWSTQCTSLSMVAEVVQGIPSTQFSLQRLISALTYISTAHHGLLSTHLERILFVKANADFEYENQSSTSSLIKSLPELTSHNVREIKSEEIE